MVGAAIETIVWSMNVIATAKIIAVKTRRRDRTPAPAVTVALMVNLLIGRDLLVGHPAAVEAERNPGGQVDAGDGFGGEVLGGEDDQIGGAAVGVVDEGHDVAVVLGGTGCGGGEDRLADGGVQAEFVSLDGTRGQVVLEQRVAEGLVGEVAAG